MQTRRLLLPKWRLHRPNPDATPPNLCRPRRLSAADAAVKAAKLALIKAKKLKLVALQGEIDALEGESP